MLNCCGSECNNRSAHLQLDVTESSACFTTRVFELLHRNQCIREVLRDLQRLSATVLRQMVPHIATGCACYQTQFAGGNPPIQKIQQRFWLKAI